VKYIFGLLSMSWHTAHKNTSDASVFVFLNVLSGGWQSLGSFSIHTPPKGEHPETSLVAEHVEVPGGRCTQRGQETLGVASQVSSPVPFFLSCSSVSFVISFIICQKHKCFPQFCEVLYLAN
jgi:hypothetical protein